MPLVCSVRTVNTLAIASAIRKLSQNVSAKPTTRLIPMKKKSITASRIVSRILPTSQRIGAVIVALFCLSVGKMQRSAQVILFKHFRLSVILTIITECSLTCHTSCAHLVPDFCGMSMETANEILKVQMQMKNLNVNKTSPVGLSNRNLRDNAPAPLAPMKPSDYGRPPSSQAISAATTSYPTPQSPTASSRQNLPPRTSSIEAQKAAEAAISGMRPPSQPSQGLFIDTVMKATRLTNDRPSTSTTPYSSLQSSGIWRGHETRASCRSHACSENPTLSSSASSATNSTTSASTCTSTSGSGPCRSSATGSFKRTFNTGSKNRTRSLQFPCCSWKG